MLTGHLLISSSLLSAQSNYKYTCHSSQASIYPGTERLEFPLALKLKPVMDPYRPIVVPRPQPSFLLMFALATVPLHSELFSFHRLPVVLLFPLP